MEKLEVGDVVQLNHGGPKMTVVYTELSDDNLVRVKWFDDKDEIHSTELPIKALKKVDQSK